MKTIKALSVCCVILLVTTVLVAGPKKAKKSTRATKPAPKQEVRLRILSSVTKYAARSFEYSTSKSNIFRGFVTFSTPDTSGKRPYVAYIYLNWGDLDDLIPRCSSKFYQNWDGHVKIQEAGYCTVVQEFFFDDGKNRKPRIGTGIDQLIKDATSQQVRWLSGIVGHTDGLLIKIEMNKPTCRGEIKAGKFVVPFSISPLDQTKTKKVKQQK